MAGVRAAARGVYHHNGVDDVLQVLIITAVVLAVSLVVRPFYFPWYYFCMKIEWNTVTWYSKLIAVVLYVGTFSIAYSMGVAMERAHTPVRSPLHICALNDE